MTKRRHIGPQLLCFAAILFAASVGTEASAERFRFRWGTGITVSEEYDDNIALRSTDKESDFITRLTPGATLSLLTEETAADLTYNLSLVHYAENDQRSRVRHFLTLSGFQGIPVAEQVTLDLIASLRISEDPFEIAAPGEDVTNAGSTESRSYRNTLGARANYFFGPEDSISLGVMHDLLMNEGSETEDRRQLVPSAGINYWFTVRYGVRVNYSYARADFDRSPDYEAHLATTSFVCRINPRTEGNFTYSYNQLEYESLRRGYAVHSFTLGLSRQFSGATFGSFSGGYFIVVPEEDENRGDFTGSFSLNHTFQRGALSLDGYAGYRRQFFQSENLGLSLFARASVTVNYQLMERLSVTATGAYFRDEYLETNTRPDTDNWRGTASLNYVFLRWLTGSLRYAYRQRESNTVEGNYVDNRVMIGVTATYMSKPMPL